MVKTFIILIFTANAVLGVRYFKSKVEGFFHSLVISAVQLSATVFAYLALTDHMKLAHNSVIMILYAFYVLFYIGFTFLKEGMILDLIYVYYFKDRNDAKDKLIPMILDKELKMKYMAKYRPTDAA